MTEDARAVRAALRRLDGDAFAALVADLWRERGWRAERQGQTVRVERDGERRTLFAVPATRRARWFGSIPEDADAVVSAAADESAAVDGPELAEMLRYAIPPAAAERLCERHLGAPPSELTLPAGVRVRRAVGTLPLRKLSATVALLVAATALAAAGPAVGPFAGSGPGPSGGADGAGATEPGTTTDPDLEIITSRSVIEMPVVEASTSDELVSDHRAAVADRSYRLRITRVRDTDLNERPLVVQETVKQVGEEYVHRLRPENDAGTISAQDIYSDGSAAYVAEYRSAASPYRYERFDTMPPGPREWMPRRMATYLNTTSVDIEPMNDTEGRHRITGNGAPPNVNASMYRFSAVRSETGLITELRVEYARDGRMAYVTWVYSPVTDASIDPPAWYERKFGAENGTPTATAGA